MAELITPCRFQAFELERRQNWRSQDNAIRVIRRFFENVFLSADTGFQRHNDGLTQWVNRWVGNLSKHLTEVVGNVANTLRQNRHRSIVTH